MAIYFLRHGESEANLKNVFAGQRDDSPLSEKGVEQAKAAAKELGKIKFNRIITSKLKRTMQTAEEVAITIGFKISDVETDERILEYDMGVFTGTPIHDITSKELVSAENAENPKHFQNRVVSFLRDIKNSSENILVVSSAGVGRIIEATKQELDPWTFYDLSPYPNAHVVKLELNWL